MTILFLSSPEIRISPEVRKMGLNCDANSFANHLSDLRGLSDLRTKPNSSAYTLSHNQHTTGFAAFCFFQGTCCGR